MSVPRNRRAWPRSPQDQPGVDAAPDRGVVFACGRNRVLEVGLRKATPNTIFYMAPGRGMSASGTEWGVWRYLPTSDPSFIAAYPPLTVGCPLHGDHLVSARKLIDVLVRLNPRPARNWPRLPVEDVAP